MKFDCIESENHPGTEGSTSETEGLEAGGAGGVGGGDGEGGGGMQAGSVGSRVSSVSGVHMKRRPLTFGLHGVSGESPQMTAHCPPYVPLMPESRYVPPVGLGLGMIAALPLVVDGRVRALPAFVVKEIQSTNAPALPSAWVMYSPGPRLTVVMESVVLPYTGDGEQP